MPIDLWGATGMPRLVPPERLLGGSVLLLAYLLTLVVALYYWRRSWRALTRRNWLTILGLSLIALTVSQLFPITITSDAQLAAPGATQNPQPTMAVFAMLPLMYAAAVLNPAAALFVGIFSGLGRALWQTHQWYEPFHIGLAGLMVGLALRQNYSERLFHWLRRPVVAGPLALVVLPLPLLVANFVYGGTEFSSLSVWDWARSVTQWRLGMLIMEMAFAGAMVQGLQFALPAEMFYRPGALVASPLSRTLRGRLVSNFILFVFILIPVMAIGVLSLSVNVSEQLIVNQMAHNAQTVARTIPDFQARRENLLRQYAQREIILVDDGEAATKALGQAFRSADLYQRLLVVDDDGAVAYAYPETGPVTLTDIERQAISQTLRTNNTVISPAQQPDVVADRHVISFVAPIVDETGQPIAALVGRVSDVSLGKLIIGLDGIVGSGNGFITNEANVIIAHADPAQLLQVWEPASDPPRIISTDDEIGYAYEGRSRGTNARELVYYLETPGQDWRVATIVPYDVVLNLSVQIAGPILLGTTAAALLFVLNLLLLSRQFSQPLTELLRAARGIQSGELNQPVIARSADEVGQLASAFEGMRRSLKRQLDDLTLLLRVSENVSSGLDLKQGLPTILQSAIRGTGAATARAVVLSGRTPLTFGAGPTADELAGYDRAVTKRLSNSREPVALIGEPVIRQELGLTDGAALPFRSLIAVPLHTQDRYLGALWLTFRQAHPGDDGERNLLSTLASQAVVLVENTRLFANAEGGRRRLAAVLASASDAIIVTDPTARVLLVNPAMEDAFDLRGIEIVGRKINEVLSIKPLIKALTESGRTMGLEIETRDARVLYANSSTIYSQDGQILGRVAVLRDITALKEIDEMKSDFVSTVSHDLRSPLASVRGFATMMPLYGSLNEQQQRSVDKIVSNIDRMSNLVESLLDLGRIEAGIELTSQPVKVRDLFADVLAEHVDNARDVGNLLKLDVPDDMPLIHIDPNLLRQAISNLVGNTHKYAPNSGDVWVRAEARDGSVIISVSDQGPGIPKQEIPRLFEKFYRVKANRSRRVRGSGLGLAIVKSIAERHGGRVWCDSELGEGTTFYILLPYNGSKM